MKLEKVTLINYAGLKRGSNIDKLTIDFTKQKHTICVIVGKNKSGKTTLQSALHPLPDSNTSFLEGEQGGKILTYSTDSGYIKLEITHPVNSKGERGTTKGSFKKLINDQWVEMNPNGNIGSYKDLVESTFGLDPSFLALSRLSSEDRGIVDKTPSERKKFVTNILENLETYNNIGRTMTKRLSNLKAMINSISSKIDSIGNEEQLQINLDSINKRIDKLLYENEQCLVIKTKNEMTIDTLDPDKTILDRYNENIASYNSLETLIEKQKNILSSVFNDKNSDIRILICDNIDKIEKDISNLEKEIFNIDSILPSLMAEYEEQKKSIELKNSRLQSLQSETNLVDLKSAYKQTKHQIEQCELLFKEMNITNPENISKDEYILALTTLKQIKENISNLKSAMYRSFILEALDRVLSEKDLYSNLSSLKERYSNFSYDRVKVTMDISKYETEVEKIKILESRPSKCKIDSCSFIADAVSIANTNPLKKLEEANIELIEIDDSLATLSARINEEETTIECAQYIKAIVRDIENNRNLLLKLPHGELFVDIKYLVDSVLNGEDFYIMDDIYNTITNANIFDVYRLAKQKIIELSSELKIYESKNDIIEELSKEVNDLNTKLNSTMDKLEDYQDQKYLKSGLLISKKDELNKFKMLEVTVNELDKNIEERDNLEKEINKHDKDMENIKACIAEVNKSNARMSEISMELKPLNQEKDKINYSLKMLTQYREELEIYNKRYTISEIIKKHSVPTTGIQLIFMRIFMGKTIKMTNELLQNFFGGDICLSPNYEINEHEFRLPCYDIPSGITNNDISNCSTSEKCMLGMLISYVLLRQSATDYNILRLDEIDGGLDSYNRLNFIPTIQNMINLLEIPQCFIISHSSETELSNVDIIQLSLPQNNVNNINGNVIYSAI